MVERVSFIDLDDTEGSMNRLADSICLIKLIARTMILQTIFTWMSIRLSRSATNSKMASPQAS